MDIEKQLSAFGVLLRWRQCDATFDCCCPKKDFLPNPAPRKVASVAGAITPVFVGLVWGRYKNFGMHPLIQLL